jgi:hypothetical protein
VDPTIEAAWIAGGVGALGVVATVITAWIGSRNTRKATEQTVGGGIASTMATLAAAREDRLWDKRAAAYEETLTGLLHRQAKRRHDLRGYRWDEASEQQLKEFFDSYDPPPSFEVQGRMVAYASEAVLDAFENANRAHGEVRTWCSHQEGLREQIRMAQESGRPQAAPDGETMIDARKKLDSAVQDAEAKDVLLIKSIRDELRSKPEAAILPATVPPAKRRGFWHGR